MLAHTCSPFDSRMWVALASVYEDVSQFDDAIRCHKRSLAIPFSKLVAMQERGNVNHSRTSISLKDARASVGDATNKKLGGMLGAGGADLSVMTADEEDVEVVETDIKTLFKIGRLYDQMGEEERASTVYRVGVDLSLAQKGEVSFFRGWVVMSALYAMTILAHLAHPRRCARRAISCKPL